MNTRQQELLKLLKKEKALKVAELCRLLDASPVTIRRDLTELEKSGVLKRMHGGAMFLSARDKDIVPDDPYLPAKQAIAKAAVKLVSPGNTLFIDNGTTNNEIANQLLALSDISIVTNSIEIAYKFIRRNDSSVYVCGGTIGEDVGGVVGPLAEQIITKFRADIFFLSTSGIDVKYGITEHYLNGAHIKEKMIENARKVILVADHSKFKQVYKAFVCHVNVIHHVITDRLAPQEEIDSLRALGIEVTLADA